MKKAKEYAALYDPAREVDSITDIMMEVLKETCELIETRKVQTAKGVYGVYTQQCQKWKAIVNAMNLDEKGTAVYTPLFKTALFSEMPEWRELIAVYEALPPHRRR